MVEETQDNAEEHVKHAKNHSHLHFERVRVRQRVVRQLPNLAAGE